jgi:cell division protein FtsB
MEPDTPVKIDRTPKQKNALPQDTEPARLMIYGGTMPPPPPPGSPEGAYLPPKNRKVTKRTVSPFNIILMLMAAAAAIVLYIGNIIAVNQLVMDIDKEQKKLQKILNDQEILKARINQMSSLERIRTRAADELGLQDPKDAPQWIDVDNDKIREIEETTPQQ